CLRTQHISPRYSRSSLLPSQAYGIHTFAKNIVIPAQAGTQTRGGESGHGRCKTRFGKRTLASHTIPAPSHFWVPACAGMKISFLILTAGFCGDDFLRFDVAGAGFGEKEETH